MNTLESLRRKLTPQMKDYDNIGFTWHPNIMFFHKENYNSNSIKTDSYGFRITSSNELNFSPESYINSNKQEEVSLIIGGSTAFGVGASSDKYHLASILTELKGTKYLNFGGRAFNSDQELFLFKNFFKKISKIKDVIIVSGANDLYLTSIKHESFMPNFFFGNLYKNALDSYNLNLKRKVLKLVLNTFGIEKGVSGKIRFNKMLKNAIKTLRGRSNEKEPCKGKDSNLISFEDAFNRTKSSLIFWSSLSRCLNFKVTFALQPTPYWCNKKLTHEEEKIFSINDHENKKASEILKMMDNTDKYLIHTEKLQNLCKELSINYLDTNKLLSNSECSKDWLFVDRIHLNDKGYKQVAKLLLNV